MPMVARATVATVIASQAVISGAFSIAQQAIQLGFSPRMEISHTSDQQMGQIYLAGINWTLLAAVIALVLGFGSSSNLAAAYGIAVTGNVPLARQALRLDVPQRWQLRQPLRPAGQSRRRIGDSGRHVAF